MLFLAHFCYIFKKYLRNSMATYVCGHKIPDTDSIVSAISLSYLKNKLGEETIPSRQGEMNPESAYVLETYGFEAPLLKESYAGESLYVTDYNNYTEAPDDIDEATILGIVDHHKLGGLKSTAPLEIWIRPVGCTNTIVKEMYDHHNIEIPKDIASIMMCAILSDTVIFKSPTCTKADTKAVKELAAIAGIEHPKEVGMKLFNIKSEVGGASPRDLVMRDFKNFDMHGQKVGIGQLEVVDLKVFDGMKEDLHADIAKLKAEGDYHSVVLLLTDIMIEGSQALISSDDNSKVEKAFDVTVENDEAWLNKVLSRKKQVIPFLEPAFK
jgi:manganese-dependent inorganic pyrophosphatase